jgi:hypothetical protein
MLAAEKPTLSSFLSKYQPQKEKNKEKKNHFWVPKIVNRQKEELVIRTKNQNPFRK